MTGRTDGNGAAFAGSQLQTQLWVNKRTADLDDALRAELPGLFGAEVEWRSPLAAERYAERWDRAFLQSVDLDEHAAALRAFWPTGGPHWDALAVIRLPGTARPGVLLVEGKSRPAELYGSGCAAEPGSPSRALIERSLEWTQQRLGVQDRTPGDWCGPLYQSANRLAHLCWLRSLGVRAWLVHLLFVDDKRSPTSVPDWKAAVQQADQELGIAGLHVEHAEHLLLPAGARSELVA